MTIGEINSSNTLITKRNCLSKKSVTMMPQYILSGMNRNTIFATKKLSDGYFVWYNGVDE